MSFSHRINLGIVAAMLADVATYTTHRTYLSPRSVPAGMAGGVLTDTGKLFAEPFDPRRGDMVECASLRGAVTLATLRREPWHGMVCAALDTAMREHVEAEDAIVGASRTYADAFAWAETLLPVPSADNPEAVYCPTFADVGAVVAAARGTIVARLDAPLSPSEVLLAVGVLIPSWRVSLDGNEAVIHVTRINRTHRAKAATADEAAADVLSVAMLFHAIESERHRINSIPRVLP